MYKWRKDWCGHINNSNVQVDFFLPSCWWKVEWRINNTCDLFYFYAALVHISLEEVIRKNGNVHTWLLHRHLQEQDFDIYYLVWSVLSITSQYLAAKMRYFFSKYSCNNINLPKTKKNEHVLDSFVHPFNPW